MNINRGIKLRKWIYYGVICILIISNIWVLSRLKLNSQQQNNNLFEDDLAQTGRIISPIPISTSISRKTRIPFLDKAGTIIYCSDEGDISFAELAILKLIGRSTLADKIGIAILYVGNPDLKNRTRDYIGTDLHFIEDEVKILKSLNIRTYTRRRLIVTNKDTIVYDGQILKQYLAMQLEAIVANSDMNFALQSLSIDDTISGSIYDKNQKIIINTLLGRNVFLLCSTYCPVCGDNLLFGDMKIRLNIEPYVIFPDIQDRETIEAYWSQQFTNQPFFQIVLDESNINADTFLLSYPVVIVVEAGKILFISSYENNTEFIINMTAKHLGRVVGNVEN